jgi:hypothetical protein
MRVALIVCLIAGTAACGGNSAAPSPLSSGTTTSVAGTWNGTIASSNNDTVDVNIVLTQSGADVNGTWQSTTVLWAGDITGAVSGSTFNGQFTFSGTAANGTVCKGTAAVAGPATASTMTLTSASGVVGAACPAPLPTAITIDLRRQS